MRHLAQTPDGRLWMGTDAGVAVYDGHDVRSISLPDSIGQRAVGDLLVQEDGTLWVEVVERGLVALRGGYVSRVFPSPEDPNYLVRLLARRDTLFAVTGTVLWTLPPGANSFRKTSYTYAEDPAPKNPPFSAYGHRIVSADVAPDGTLWVLTSRRGLARLETDGSLTFPDVHLPLGSDRGRMKLRFAADGSAFVATWAGAYRLLPSTEALQKLSSHKYSGLSTGGNTVYAVRP